MKEDTMNGYEKQKMELLDFYRGGELPPGRMEAEQGMEAPGVNNVQAGAPAVKETPEPDAGARAEWIETWMNDIKAFIRNIDVQSL